MEQTQQDAITPRWLRPRQWQQITGMGRTHTYELIKTGQLRAVTIGRAVFIDAREVEALFERAAQAA